MATLFFEFPSGWLLGIPLALVVAFRIFAQRRRGLTPSQLWTIGSLRAVAVIVLVGHSPSA